MTGPSTLTRTVYQRMRTLRDQHSMSARVLAEHLTAAGHPITRDMIAGQESGRVQSVSVDQLFALARVFDVPVATFTDSSACPTCGQALPTTGTETP